MNRLSELMSVIIDDRDVFHHAVVQWFAVCLSDVGDYEGIKVKIGNSYIIKDHLEVKGLFY